MHGSRRVSAYNVSTAPICPITQIQKGEEDE